MKPAVMSGELRSLSLKFSHETGGELPRFVGHFTRPAMVSNKAFFCWMAGVRGEIDSLRLCRIKSVPHSVWQQ